MSSHGGRVARDLGRLHDLARRLFELVSAEYRPVANVTLHLSECNALAENPHCSDPVVRTVLVAQMLWYATHDPAVANPRHVVGLGLFVEELIPTLVAERPPGHSMTAQRLHEIRGDIDGLCMNLAIAADPGIPEFGRG
jgi:hypothetical protein